MTRLAEVRAVVLQQVVAIVTPAMVADATAIMAVVAVVVLAAEPRRRVHRLHPKSLPVVGSGILTTIFRFSWHVFKKT